MGRCLCEGEEIKRLVYRLTQVLVAIQDLSSIHLSVKTPPCYANSLEMSSILKFLFARLLYIIPENSFKNFLPSFIRAAGLLNYFQGLQLYVFSTGAFLSCL